MRRLRSCLAILGSIVLAAPAAAQQTGQGQDATAEVARQLSAVLVDAPEIRGNRGYLEIAQTELAVALEALGRAGHQADNLPELKRSVSQALNALSPSISPQGPGLGVGAIEAMTALIDRLELAAAQAGREDVELAATPAIVATQAARLRARKAAELGQEAIVADDPQRALDLAGRMTRLISAAMTGVDMDGDGEVTWNMLEGGLYHTHVYSSMVALGAGVASPSQVAQIPPQ